jgi:outer membrane protein
MVRNAISLARAGPGRFGLAVIPAFVAASLAFSVSAHAETLESALARAYHANPVLNAQRAGVRSTDENVPRALAGARPRVNASGDVGYQHVQGRTAAGQRFQQDTFPRGVGIAVDQTIWNGNRTFNSVRQAESQVLSARDTLRNTEQTVLLDGVTAYMDVLRDTASLNLQRNNIEVIDEQLRQTRTRFEVGEVTRTDVAQAEARLAAARSQAAAAEARLRESIARFRRVIGIEPRRLAPARPIDRLIPRTVAAAIQIGLAEHPAIISALHAVDAAELQVKVVEGELYPTLGVRGTAAQRWDVQGPGDERLTASVVGTLTVPLYEGGEVYARVRQAKELVGQRRFEAESLRDQVRAAVMTAWGQLDAVRAQIEAAQAQIQAAETALAGTREEARVGQRTTLDVLNAQQELLVARVNLIQAQRDRVVVSYQLVQAMGRLSRHTLALNVEAYRPKVHYDQVKDLWYGTRTPSGR